MGKPQHCLGVHDRRTTITERRRRAQRTITFCSSRRVWVRQECRAQGGHITHRVGYRRTQERRIEYSSDRKIGSNIFAEGIKLCSHSNRSNLFKWRFFAWQITERQDERVSNEKSHSASEFVF